MSRELRSDTVSPVDRSSDVANEQPASQLEREDMSTESVVTTSDAAPTADEITDPVIINEPTAATSSERSSSMRENESASTVSIITSTREVMFYPVFVCLFACLLSTDVKTADRMFVTILPNVYLSTREMP